MPLMTPVRTIALSNAAVVSWVTMDSHAKIINVVGAAIVRDGAVLCAQRGPGKSLAGYWEFPGGKIEPYETSRQALHREIELERINFFQTPVASRHFAISWIKGHLMVTSFYLQG